MKILLIHRLTKALPAFDFAKEYDAVYSLQELGLQELGVSTVQMTNESGFSQTLAEIRDRAREELVDFVAEFPSGLKHKFPEWRGLSIWWANALAKKDPENENTYFYQLTNLLWVRDLVKRGHKVTFLTDDNNFIRALRENFPNVQIYEFGNYNWLSSFRALRQGASQAILSFFCQLYGIFFKANNGSILSNSKNVFFISYFPSSWIQARGRLVDRHYSITPQMDYKFDRQCVFLVFPTMTKSDLFNPFLYLKKMSKFVNSVHKPLVILTKGSIFTIPILVAKCAYWYLLLRFKVLNDEAFQFDGLNARSILYPMILADLLNGNTLRILAQTAYLQHFLKNQPPNQTIVSYSQLFPESKFFAHSIHPKSIYVTVQHAMESKNKFSNYHRELEVSNSPTPDLYLCQGVGYAEILSKYYPLEKIRTIGCLKYDEYWNDLQKKDALRSELFRKYALQEKKTIFIAPSVMDLGMIFSFLKEFKSPYDFNFLLKLHPASPPGTLTSYAQVLEKLKVRIVDDKISHLLASSDLVICGYSTVGIEAAIFGADCVRVQSKKVHALFDPDPNIPVAYSPEELENLIANNQHLPRPNLEFYFYKVDGRCYERFWKVINQTTRI